MYIVRDMRETRFYKDAFADGYQQGLAERRQQGMMIGIAIAIARKTGVAVRVADVAAILDEDVELIRQTILKYAPDCLEPGTTQD